MLVIWNKNYVFFKKWIFVFCDFGDNGIGIINGFVFISFGLDCYREVSYLFLILVGWLNFMLLKVSVIICKINLNNCFFYIRILDFFLEKFGLFFMDEDVL